jgi:hypothetical protein
MWERSLHFRSNSGARNSTSGLFLERLLTVDRSIIFAYSFVFRQSFCKGKADATVFLSTHPALYGPKIKLEENMKKFIMSRLLHKVATLAILTGVLAFVYSDKPVMAAAEGGACCSYCVPIWNYCNQHQGEYKSWWQCVELNGGSECEVCNPTC